MGDENDIAKVRGCYYHQRDLATKKELRAEASNATEKAERLKVELTNYMQGYFEMAQTRNTAHEKAARLEIENLRLRNCFNCDKRSNGCSRFESFDKTCGDWGSTPRE